MTHELKTWPQYFRAVKDMRKTFEIRFNDRNFQVGDTVILKEFIPDTAEYTGLQIKAGIGYITSYEQKPGYVVFALINHKQRRSPKW